ncbi:hypothetical protein KC717_01610 [Candidatus Dojkabacteria bacterium]|uniref:Uncharacterized protein n=1 Tax=Candidatus Dojkabacteria bacterium TaxID=2099670 RepID=A0A955L7D7_9BACT|nr:hypothetical protein [Candidatus Dojkabacteria bacterium]
MSGEILSGDKAEPLIQLGHIAELNTRETRHASDKVNIEVIPELAHKLAEGDITLSDILSINKVYFQRPGIAGAHGSPAFQINQVKDFDVRQALNAIARQDVSGVRKLNVNNGYFAHPEVASIKKLAPKAIEKLNEFITSVPSLSDEDIWRGIAKFYLVFWALHIPEDGSGRLSGDLDTLIQKSVQQKLKKVGREFTPKLISENGWRILGTGDERNMNNETKKVEALLVGNFLDDLSPDSKSVINKLRPNLLQNFSGYKCTSKELKEVLEVIMSSELVQKEYYEKLELYVGDMIDYEFEIAKLDMDSPRAWFRGNIHGVTQARNEGKGSWRYLEFREPVANLIDSLVGHLINKDLDLLEALMSDTNNISPDFLEIRGINIVIHSILENVKNLDKKAYKRILDNNSSLKPLAKKKR